MTEQGDPIEPELAHAGRLRSAPWAHGRWFGTVLAVIAGISLAIAVVRVPAVVRYGYHHVRRAPSSLREADIAPLGATAPTSLFTVAAKTIPRNDSFAVVGGGNDVLAALRLWLTPRVFEGDYHNAHWVIAVGDPVPADVRAGRKVRLAPGAYAVEVAR